MAICNEEGCQVLATGVCVNGLSLEECPHYDEFGEAEEEPGDAVVDDESELSPLDVVEVYNGKAILLGDVDRISTNSETRLIILAGMPDAGKTTLLLSLMHIFCNASNFGDYIFAGSETLLDYEEKSHSSKVDSGNDEENTGRTPVGLTSFLHLKVSNQAMDGKMTNLLFTDISGEDFRTLKDSTAECENFSIGRRADHFVIFFDTLRISSLSERATTKQAGLAILRSLIEAGTLLSHTRIQVVFSRWDLKTAENAARDDQFIGGLKTQILALTDELYEVEFVEVAARPGNSDIPFGFGLDKLLPTWVESSIVDNQQPRDIVSQITSESRQFLKYKVN